MDAKKAAYWFLFAITLIFLIKFLFEKNYEFVIYVAVVWFLLGLIVWSDKIFDYSAVSVWGFSIWGMLHMFGGGLLVGTTRLYDLILIPIVGDPYHILKYDQALHFYTYVVIAFICYEIVFYYVKERNWAVFLIAALMAIGISGLNEVVEFAAVVLLANEGVGGYYNTALDLVANTLGAFVGVFIKQKL